ncbi:GTP-binding protein YihA [Gammaproteobacteria bacterium]
MSPRYQQVGFILSAARLEQAPSDSGCEVAFAGRSNAGKSTAINTLCGQRNLARTSKTPGRTQLLNFFRVDEGRYLVDLPGYGFAQVAESIKQQWQAVLQDYLIERQALKGLILLMDIRHPLRETDRQMLIWSNHRSLPLHILLTKADKLKRGPALATLHRLLAELKQQGWSGSAQLFSGVTRQGVAEVHEVLDRWLGFRNPAPSDPPAHT